MVNFDQMLIHSKAQKLVDEYYDKESELRKELIQEIGFIFLSKQFENCENITVKKSKFDAETEVFWYVNIGNDYVGIGLQFNRGLCEYMDMDVETWDDFKMQKSCGKDFDSGAKDFETWADIFTYIIKNYFNN